MCFKVLLYPYKKRERELRVKKKRGSEGAREGERGGSRKARLKAREIFMLSDI